MKTAQLLRLPLLVEIVGAKKSTLYDWMNPESPRHDPTFPKPIKIGTSAVAWISYEVEDWVQSKIQIRNGF